MDTNDAFDPFSVSEIWAAQAGAFDEEGESPPALFAPFIADVPTIKLDNPYAPSKTLDQELALPKLESLDLSPPEDLTVSDGSVFSFEPDQNALDVEDDYDLWRTILDNEPSDEGRKLYSWEGFADKDWKEPGPLYISEAGPEAFDAALQRASREKSTTAGKPLQSNVLFKSLLSLGLGRSSRLFNFNKELSKFEQLVEGSRIPGHSLKSSEHFISEFLRCGNAIRRLRDFTTEIYQTIAPVPGLVALASDIATILSAVEGHVNDRAPTLRSFLQLQATFTGAVETLCTVERIVHKVKHARTDEELISRLFDEVQRVEQQSAGLRSVLRHMLRDVTRPWLETAGAWAGLGLSYGDAASFNRQRPAFVRKEGTDSDDTAQLDTEISFDAAKLPSPIPEDTGQALFEIGRSLRLLRNHHGSHPLCSPNGSNVPIPELDMVFGWEDVHRITADAKRYEGSVAAAVLHHQSEFSEVQCQQSAPSPNSIEAAVVPQSKGLLNNWDQFANEILEQSPALNTTGLPSDELSRLVLSSFSHEALDTDSDHAFQPELSLAPTLSFSPLLAAQARLVYAATLRRFFRSHHLRAHLELQHQFHLLGNGSFVTRFTSALFDPDRATAERHKGVVRTGESMGLRLGTRSTWPPASSELQLALMGILSDCYRQSKLASSFGLGHPTRSKDRGEIPGNLSFAVRQLPPEEADRCMDPDSLYALDFLRLQYSPPSPLDAIITPATLEKYDAIFKALLRLIRMLFVVSHIPRRDLSLPQQKFRVEINHFVSACAGYFFNTGIGETWTMFSNYLDGVEKRLKKEDETESLGHFVSEGLEDLRKAHERCLDQIMFSLLLRKRQAQVMGLLEEIFGIVLAFVMLCNSATADGDAIEKDAAGLRETFRSKVNVFRHVCRGLVGKKGYGKGTNWDGRGSSSGEDNTIDRLLLVLDMNGYYESYV